MSVGTPLVTAGTGTSQAGYASYTVTVSVTASMTTSLMQVVGIKTLPISVTATAANPVVQPIITVGPIGSYAADWNAVYMFAIPTNAAGQPIYSQMPTYADLYEIASNCSNVDSNWTTLSACNSKPGAVIPANQTFPAISGTQPLGFLFENMMNSQQPVGDPGRYGYANQYNARVGDIMLFNTAWVNSAPGVLSGNSPSYLTDSSATLMPSLTGPILGDKSLQYTAQVNSKTANDCSLAIEPVDPNNVPDQWTFYNNYGVRPNCLPVSHPLMGMQYANLSCAQINGQTLMYWWNDMGNNPDDKNYIDLYYTIHCVPGFGNPNGGQLYQGNTVPVYNNLGVSLLR